MIIVIDIKFYFMITTNPRLSIVNVVSFIMKTRRQMHRTLEIADTLSNCIDSSMNYWFANVSKWIKWHVVFLESCRYNDCLQHRWVNVNSHGDEDGFRLYAANMNGQETQLAHWICRIFQLASYFLLNNHKWLLSIVATRDRWWRVI